MEPRPNTEPSFPKIEVDVFAKLPPPEETKKRRTIPIPKLHKATGQAYLYYKGKMYYFGKYGSQKADTKYWAWRAKFGKQVAEGFLMYELIEQYVKRNVLSKNGKCHIERIKVALGSFINQNCNQFGPLAYRELRNQVASTGDRCAHTINATMQTFQRMFRWGVSVQVVTMDVYSALKTVPPLKNHEVERQGKPRQAISRQVVEATLPFLNPHVQHMVILQLATGARPNEILSIETKHITKDGPRGTWVYRPEQHKTSYRGKSRQLVFGERAQAVIAKQMELNPSPEGWLFPTLDRSERQGHFMGQSYRKAVMLGAAAAKQPHWFPYQIRHLRLSELTTDHGLETAAAVAGHGDTQVTQGYAHGPDAKDIRNATGDEKPATQPDLVQAIERLASLREKGLLTEEEFRLAKGKLLG